jgi:hypothetical protein
MQPGHALLRLEPAESREGSLDGAWWPRSRDITTELPALLTALTPHIGPVSRVGLDAASWDGLPTRLVVDDRVVHIDSFPVGDGTALITRGERDLLSLLVIPPHMTPEAAHAVVDAALPPGSGSRTTQILVDTGGGPGPSD